MTHRTLAVLAALAAIPVATTACSGGGSSGSPTSHASVGTAASESQASEGASARTAETNETNEADDFGVTMLYPSAPGGDSWALADDATNDPRFDPQVPITRNEDGSWKMRNGKVRMEVFTSSGYDPAGITTDREVLAKQGYMQDAHDWKNVEITGFVKVNHASNPADNFAWYARGGRHTDGIGCEGSSYKGGLHYDGRVRFEKESWHVDYDQGPYESATSSLVGRWVGFKTVIRNETVGGKDVVHLELWLNDSGDKVTWSKVYDLVDDGTWGGDAGHCGGLNPAMPITWGGPIATFRWDSAEDVDFKWMSVREIQ